MFYPSQKKTTKLHAFVFALWIARGEAKNQGIWGPIKEANNKIEEIGNLTSLMICVGEMEECPAVAESELKKKQNPSNSLEVDVRKLLKPLLRVTMFQHHRLRKTTAALRNNLVRLLHLKMVIML